MLPRRADEDSLTGLWNRRHVDHLLPRMLHDAGARDEPVSVALIDVDHFKEINDGYGHLAGDEVLRQIGAILRAHSRPSDIVARIGGEEFVVVLPGAGTTEALRLGRRLRDAVRDARWSAPLHARTTTISVGVATLPAAARALDDAQRAALELLERADRALYRAKRAGRNRVEAHGDRAA